MSDIRVTAPGRVNLLGEHVDYNDGPVLPVAINRSVRLQAASRPGRRVRIEALAFKQAVEFDLDHLAEKLDVSGRPLPGWAHYPAGVAWALQSNGLAVGGIDAAVDSDIPIGAGLSSSAAMEVAFATLWQHLQGWSLDKMTLARCCQQAENRYVGVNCGLMDQFASIHGVAGHALYFDTRSLEWRPVRLPENCAVVIADSGVRHKLSGSSYNERRAACEEAVRLLKQKMSGIRALRDVSVEDFRRCGELLPEVVRRRAQHVVEECARVDQAIGYLEGGDAAAFGQLMYAGHASLRDLFEVSTPELDCLVELACELPGCWGARMTGGGFGGCTVNLVREAQAEAFMRKLKEGYLKATGRETEIYLCHASQGARVLDGTPAS
jgi:galactokinase